MPVTIGTGIILPEVLTVDYYCSRHLERQPVQKWRKAELKDWLDSKGKCFRFSINLITFKMYVL